MTIRAVTTQWLTVTSRAITRSASGTGSRSKTPDWALFWSFPVAFVIALVVLFAAAWLTYRNHKAGDKGTWTNTTASRWWFREELHVGAKWTLKDSWASNVTVLAAAFAGFFGSSNVVKSLVGTSGSPILGLTTVSAAVAVAAVGAAPLLLQIFKVNGDVTPAGLLIGAAVTMGATGGELAVICLGVRQLPLGGVQHVLAWAGLIGGGLVLAVYTFTNMTETLSMHLRKRSVKGQPPKPLAVLSELANTRLAQFHSEVPAGQRPLDLVASAYEEPMATEASAGVF